MNLDFQFLIFEVSKIYQSLLRTKQLHTIIIKTHLTHDPFYATRLVRLYDINGKLCSARQVFDKSPNRSVYLWNSVIRANARAHEFDEALYLFCNMLRTEIKPDNFTFSCLIRACTESFNRERLKFVHGRTIASGLALDSICCSALVTAYSKLGLVDEASEVFTRVPQPDLVMWNSIIFGYASCGFLCKGLHLFSKMRHLGNQPDGHTIVGLVSNLADSSLLRFGKGIHGFCLKTNVDSNVHVGSVLVSMYSRCNCMDSAYLVFSGLSQHDLVTWSALITGYSQSGDHGKSLLSFKKLMKSNKADSILIASMLATSAQSSKKRHGVEIHGYVFRHGFESDVMVSSSLIDMYSKCGFVSLGMKVFRFMSKKNVVSYNAVISGLGLHGLASQALEVFEEMVKTGGLLPDESTFSALLCACCHAGLVRDGREFFRRMEIDFGIKARVEHHVYMVKLIGMAGQLEEAYDFILCLKEQVDCGIWGALLSCCDVYGNVELAEIIREKLLGNSTAKSAYTVMLSNLYAGEGRWDDVKKLRLNLTERDMGKTPGLSWIEGCRE